MEAYTFGRPTEYKPEYCQLLIDHLSRGFSLESFGGVVNAGKSTLYRWREAHEDFRDALEIGRAKGQMLMEQKGHDGMIDRFQAAKINNQMYKLFMANLYGWTDKHEVAQPVEQQPIPIAFIPKSDRVKKSE